MQREATRIVVRVAIPGDRAVVIKPNIRICISVRKRKKERFQILLKYINEYNLSIYLLIDLLFIKYYNNKILNSNYEYYLKLSKYSNF